MRTIRKMMSVLMTMAIVMSLGLSTLAVHAEEYTYKITLSAGTQGTFEDGSKTMVVGEYPYGENAPVDPQLVVLPEDTKYYVKGIRLAGHDELVYDTTVTEDAAYVVVYGIKADLIAYTVNYIVSETEETLLESRTYYANIGDQITVPYQYVEGYQPQAYNLRKVLTENAAENVFTFEYTPLVLDVTNTVTEVVENVVTLPGETIVQPGIGNDVAQLPGGEEIEDNDIPAGPGEEENVEDENGGNEENGGGENVEDENDGNENEEIDENDTPLNPGGEDIGGEEETVPSEPEEIIDLDEQDVPTSDGNAVGTSSTVPVVAATVGVFLAALIAVLVVIMKKRAAK